MVGSSETAPMQEPDIITLCYMLYSQRGAELLKGGAVGISVDDTVAGLRPSAVSTIDCSKYLHIGHNNVSYKTPCHVSSCAKAQ